MMVCVGWLVGPSALAPPPLSVSFFLVVCSLSLSPSPSLYSVWFELVGWQDQPQLTFYDQEDSIEVRISLRDLYIYNIYFDPNTNELFQV
mgnify:CR=1 FL=1